MQRGQRNRRTTKRRWNTVTLLAGGGAPGIITRGNASQGRWDASQTYKTGVECKTENRACGACGGRSRLKRSWQKQCSQKCRQRIYLERKAQAAVGYFAA